MDAEGTGFIVYHLCLHGHVSCDVKYNATSVPNECRTDEINEVKVERIRVYLPVF
jgi:hypothetical protein